MLKEGIILSRSSAEKFRKPSRLKLQILALNFFAKNDANVDFPEAGGPSIITIMQ
jgi:hypothetical protein